MDRQVGGPIGLKLGVCGRSPLGHVLHPVGGVDVALRHAHEGITSGMQTFGRSDDFKGCLMPWGVACVITGQGR